MQRVCEICGKGIENLSVRAIHCRECAAVLNRERSRARYKKVSAARRAAKIAAVVLEGKTAVQKSLAEINAEARKTGLTYGQYTALKEGGKI